ncbi:DsbA family protein [Roseivivax sp. CAU 1761]
MKTALAAAAVALAAAPALAFEITDLSQAEREAFRAEVRDYLMENPEVILEAVEALEERQAASQAEADKEMVAENAEALFSDGRSWVGGNPEGDVTLVEFMDYRCGYCRRAKPEVEELVASDGNIRFVVKEFPILGEASVTMSRFAVAVREVAGDEAYKAAHDALMEMNGDPSETVLRRLADSLDLDAEAVLSAMDDEGITEELQANRALAQEMGISGTPTFIMGDEMLRGYLPLDDMQMILDDVRERG